MVLLLQLLLTALVVLLAVPVLLLAVEIVCAVLTVRQVELERRARSSGVSPAVAIVVPAHNETKIIGKTLKKLRHQLSASDRLVVVADNCTDDTAEIAAHHGAEVVVRKVPDQRGKGYALDAGIRHLEGDPPEIVIIIDADCHVHDGAVRTLAECARETGAASQALYLVCPHEHAKLGQRISAFAFVVKNHARLLGLKRLGVSCHLTGTGMAFPWDVIRVAQLATGNIVEDMKLGIDLVRNRTPAVFCPEALVTSTFPLDDASVVSQRTRWEHGHLHTIVSEMPKLARYCLRHRQWKGLAFALDLAIPPLTLLAGLLACGLAITSVAALSGVGLIQWVAILSLTGIFTVSLFIAWVAFGREVLPLRAVAAIPAYIASKFVLYSQFRPGRKQEWVRTRRD